MKKLKLLLHGIFEAIISSLKQEQTHAFRDNYIIKDELKFVGGRAAYEAKVKYHHTSTGGKQRG
jgi:hypothetical protein